MRAENILRVFLIALLLFLLGILLVSSAHAMSSPNYGLDWLVPLSGGGGAAQSANYTVHMTVGQTAVGSAESTAFQANLGYWFGILQDGWTHVHLPIIVR